jgi:hypothetical protein
MSAIMILFVTNITRIKYPRMELKQMMTQHLIHSCFEMTRCSCQTEKIIYMEYYVLCTTLQKSLE